MHIFTEYFIHNLKENGGRDTGLSKEEGGRFLAQYPRKGE